MFSHITAQRRPMPLITASKNTLFQTRKHYLNIAVGLALTCLTVQVQAADKTQSDNEFPVPEAAFEFEDYQVSQDANTAAQDRQVVSKEFIAQQAKLFF